MRNPILFLIPALGCLPAGTAAKCYEFAMRNMPASETVWAATEKAAVIAEVEKDLKAPVAERRFIAGKLAAGNGGINGKWSWHFAPADWTLAEASIEVCDARPSYVEANRDEWLSNVKTFCPWSSYVSRECAPTRTGTGTSVEDARLSLRGPAGSTALAAVLPVPGHAVLLAFRADGTLAGRSDLGYLEAGNHELSAPAIGPGLVHYLLELGGRPAIRLSAVTH